jgi:hypothetical protein
MTKNYKELINIAVDNNDWDSAVKLCQEAKDETAERTIFGMKKGYINVIRVSSWKTTDILKPGFENLGYKCYNTSDLKNKYEEIIATYPNEIVVFFTTDETTVSKLAKKFLPITYFNSSTRTKRGKSYSDIIWQRHYVHNDTERYTFEKFDDLIAIYRQNQMDSILNED